MPRCLLFCVRLSLKRQFIEKVSYYSVCLRAARSEGASGSKMQMVNGTGWALSSNKSIELCPTIGYEFWLKGWDDIPLLDPTRASKTNALSAGEWEHNAYIVYIYMEHDIRCRRRLSQTNLQTVENNSLSKWGGNILDDRVYFPADAARIKNFAIISSLRPASY